MKPHIILASKSERRKEILKREGFDFDIYVPNADEKDIIGEKYSEELLNECAMAKARAAYEEIVNFTPMSIIVSCDTVVVNDGVIIGKPKDRDDAIKILKSLSGMRHMVISTICICRNGKYETKSDTTYVTFKKISDEEIEKYVDERKPYDKAGSYGIQDEKFDFVESIDGSMDNVVGFPIEIFKEMLGELKHINVIEK